MATKATTTPQDALPPAARETYRLTMATLDEAGLPFLVGGSYAFAYYTAIARQTKDFDIFVRRIDFAAVLSALAARGFQVEQNYPHWLGKAYRGEHFVDVIFSSGNGVAKVDDLWFANAPTADVLGLPARLCPVEEMIWSKAFVMERERFDGADVAHLLHCCAEGLDWRRLLLRFADDWRVLLSHLILFAYIYPAAAARLPPPVLESRLARLRGEQAAPPGTDTLCRGPVLSRAQYLVDLDHRGYRDARLPPSGSMSEREIAIWTAAIEEEAYEEAERSGEGGS
ncbi:MAG TPA: hypothetical protein VGE98_14375 [Thermoanaerobaculia bacterium]